MRKTYLSMMIAFCIVFNVKGQTSFSDNFDTYTAGAWLGTSSTAWKTWGNKPGGADDIKISNAKAKSGSNSLYFTSTAQAGGPSDIVLPFGGNYNTGTFTMSMSLFVDNAKKAYFNIQEQTTLGKGWTVDVNFDSTGLFNLVNNTGGTLLTGDYSQGVWMKVEFVVDLSSNTWDFKIDNVSRGKFENTYRQVAAMDIYPIQNSSYYIDDVMYSYTPATPVSLDASLTFIDKVIGKLATQVVVPTVEIRNLGTTVITSASIDLTYNGIKQTKNLTGLNIAPLATFTTPVDNSIVIQSNNSTVTATITTVNGVADDVAANNSKSIDLNAVTPALGKVVVAEEATGTWCQWCPRGAVWLKNMDEKYNGLIIGIAVHNADPMTNSNYDKGLGARVSSYPSMVVDRGVVRDPSAMEPDFLTRIMTPAVGTIRNGATYNSNTKELKVSLTTKFSKAVTGAYRIAFVLTEDSVTGTSAAYNQANAYGNNANGIMGGFELLPNPVPASKMVYSHVGRIIYPNFLGLPNSFPATINANDEFTHNFSVILDQGYNFSKLSIIGLLIDPSGKIENGSTAFIEQAISNGYVNGTMVASLQNINSFNGNVNVFPNPSTNVFTVQIPEHIKGAKNVSVFDMQGNLIQVTELNNELTSIDAQAWPAGVYVGVIKHEGGNIQVKFIKE